MSDWSWQPPADSGITVRMQAANGVDLELAELCAVDGNTKRLALLVHGFPELNFSWRYQMPMLAARGWRVWAPNLRGYGASDKPTGIAAYRLDTLAEDLGALIDASGAQEVMLVAHDWGAIIAWHFAIKRVRPLAKLIIMNVPHPACAAREIKHWHQLSKSWYIFFFQLPWLPEWLMARGNGKGIKGAIYRMAVDKSAFPRDVLQTYASAAMRPGALTAMINYYRALLRLPDGRRAGSAVIDVPTLMIWGEEDLALDKRCTIGTEAYVRNFTLHCLPGVSHWVQQEALGQVNALIEDWLAHNPY